MMICPYFLSFVEYGIINPKYFHCRAGRLEVNDEREYGYAAVKEYGYMTDKVEKYEKFREFWDFKYVPWIVLKYILWRLRRMQLRRC